MTDYQPDSNDKSAYPVQHPADIVAAAQDEADREKTRVRIFTACHRVLHRDDPPPPYETVLTCNGIPI